MIGIFIFPIPLVADRLDGEIGRGRRILVGEKPDRGHRDDDQDQHRNQRPDHFERGIMGVARRRRVGAAPVADDHPAEQRQHEQRDHRDQRHQDDVVEPGGLVADRADLVLKPVAAVGLAHARRRRGARCGGRGRGRGVGRSLLADGRRGRNGGRCGRRGRGERRGGRQAEGGGNGDQLGESLHLRPCDPPGGRLDSGAPGALAGAL